MFYNGEDINYAIKPLERSQNSCDRLNTDKHTYEQLSCPNHTMHDEM